MYDDDVSTLTLPPCQVPESTSCILVERGFLRQLRGSIYVKGVSERHGKVRHRPTPFDGVIGT